MNYAGFWVRVVAAIIDSVCLLPIYLFMYFWISLGSVGSGDYLATFKALSFIVSVITPWLYEAIFYSSPWQATPGKKVLNLRVVDSNGGRISFGRASARYFSKILSTVVLMAGYIMVAFHDKKRGLHDVIAGTFVLQGNPSEDGALTRVVHKVPETASSLFSSPDVLLTNTETWVLAGFDENGHVVRITLTSQDLERSSNGVVVGRDSTIADFVIDSVSVSRQHVRLTLISGCLYASDLESTNGSQLNDRKLDAKPVMLSVGDRLTLGSVELTIGKY